MESLRDRFIDLFKKERSLLVTLLSSALVLVSCGDNGFLSISASMQIQGVVKPYSPSFSSKVGAQSLSCSNAVASLYKISEEGSLLFPAEASTEVSPDGLYQFTDVDGTGMGLTPDSINSAHMVMVVGCGKIFATLLTGSQSQNISYGSTIVAFVMGTTASQSAYDVFLNSKAKEVDQLIGRLNSQPSFDDAFDFLNVNISTKNLFINLFGFDPMYLENAAPMISMKNFPKGPLAEGESFHLEVLAFHWNPAYTTDILWKKGTADLSTLADFIYVPDADSQEESAQIRLYVGKDDGGGQIDFTKPYASRSFERTIENTLPATVPPVILASSPFTANPVVSLQMDTGSGLSNCDSFSQIAIAEGSLIAPSAAEFDSQNLSCSSAPTQIFNYTLQDQTDGPKYLRVWVRDSAGNISEAAEYVTMNLDSSAPTLGFTSPAMGTVAQSTLNISGTCDSSMDVDISGTGVDSASSVACTAGSFTATITFSAGDGNKDVTISQTDLASNTTSDLRTFVRDVTAPILAFTSPAANTPAQSGVTIAGSCEDGLTISLSGSGLSSPSTTTCSGGSFSQAVIFTSGNGVKTVTVSQTDSAGNTGTDSRDFVKDTTAPLVAFTAPAANTSAQSGVTIEGTCEAGLSVSLSGSGLASPSSTTCAAGTFSQAVTFTSGDGSKTITVSQTDAAGNTGSASRIFIKDTTAPTLAFTAPAANTEAQTGVTIEGSCETGLSVALSGAGLSSPSSTTCIGGNFSQAIVFTSSDGAKAITISQTDAAGNTSTISRNFVRDSTAPVLAFTSPAANTIAQTGVTIEGTCEDGLSVDLSGSGLASPTSTTCSSGNFSQAVTFTSGDGSKTITVSQTDAAGNTGSSSRDFMKDNTGPAVTIDAPAANTRAQSSMTLTGDCEDGLTLSFGGSGILSSFDTTCSGGTYSQTVFFSSGDGTKTITVSQTDALGNPGSVSRDFVRDNTPPSLTQTLRPSPYYTKTNTASFGGACETGLNVDVQRDGTSEGTASCSSGSWSYTTSSQTTDGSRTYTFKQTDEAGNEGSISAVWVRDTAAPSLAITSSDNLTTSSNTVTFSGTCESGTGNSIAVKRDGVSEGTATCSSGSWSYTTASQTTDATRGYAFIYSDQAGNSTMKNATWERNTQVPNLLITTTSPVVTNTNSTTVEGTCETGLNVEIRLGGTLENSIACSSGSFSYSLSTRTTDATRTYEFKQTNALSLSTVQNFVWTRDTTAPTFVASQMFLENDAALTKKTFIELDAKATDSGSKITHVCFKTEDTVTPTLNDDCWVDVSDPSIGQSPAATVLVSNYGYNLPLVPDAYKVYGWAKDQATNISALTNSGSGTLNQDYDEITYVIPEPPSVDDLIVSKTDAPSQPLTNSDLTIGVAQPVFIKWSISDNHTLPSGKISLYFTTDDVTFNLIASGLSQGANGSCTVNNGTTTIDDNMTGCYKWASLPSSSYFRVRVTVEDDEGLTAGSTSYGLNVTGTISYLAGNTDPGIGYSAASAVYFNRNNSSIHYPSFRSLAVARNGLMFYVDAQRGLLKMDPQDGMLNLYIPITGTSSGDGGSASAATLATLEAIALDYTQPTQRLWLWDNDRIRRIDLATGVISTVIGGSGSDNADTVNDPLQVRIDRTTNDFWQNAGVFFADKSGKFYFQGYNDMGTGALNASTKTRVKVYNPDTNKVTSIAINSLPNMGSRPTGDYMDCHVRELGFEMNSSKVPVRMIASVRSALSFPGCDSGNYIDFAFIDIGTGAGETDTPATPINSTIYHQDYGRFVQGLDGKLYFYGKYPTVSGIWRYNEGAQNWTRIFGSLTQGFCADGTAALSCNSKLEDVFVSENGTLYFVESGVIRTITASNTVQTLFGQSFISGVGGPALAARLGADLQVFHARADGTIAFNELSSYKYFEFKEGGNLFHIAGNGGLGSAATGVDATTTAAGLDSSVDNYLKYFALDPSTGDIYHSGNTWNLMKLKRSSAAVGATAQWESWLGGGSKSYADPTADGTSDIGFNVDCDLNHDASTTNTPICVWREGVLGLGGSKLLVRLNNLSYLNTTQGYVYRNNAHKLYDLTSKIQSNLAFTNTGTTNLYEVCPDGTPLSACVFWPQYNGYASSPTYNPNTNTWYFSRRGLNKVYMLTPGGTMQSFSTTQGINAIAYRDAGSEEYLYYCSSSSGQIRKYNLTTSTDTALTWPVSSVSCQRSTMEWNETLGGVIFIYKQDGSQLSGLALYKD